MPNRRLIMFLSTIVWMSNCLAEDGFRICFQETEGSSQCQGPKHTCSGWSSNPAWTHFEMTPTIEMEAVTTSGKSKHIKTSNQTSSTVSAFKRQKEARNVKEHEALAPAGAKARPGHNISAMTPTKEMGAAVTLGKSSLNQHRPTQFQPVGCASKKLRAALSARVTAKAAVDCSAKENPEWTLPFRDDTDNRGGGCAYYWYLDCQYSKCGAALNCPRDSPC